jgi:hypothetical protein
MCFVHQAIRYSPTDQYCRGPSTDILYREAHLECWMTVKLINYSENKLPRMSLLLDFAVGYFSNFARLLKTAFPRFFNGVWGILERRCRADAKLTGRIFPSYEHFPPTPCFVNPLDAKPPTFGEGSLLPSFLIALVSSLLRRGSDFLVN